MHAVGSNPDQTVQFYRTAMRSNATINVATYYMYVLLTFEMVSCPIRGDWNLDSFEFLTFYHVDRITQ